MNLPTYRAAQYIAYGVRMDHDLLTRYFFFRGVGVAGEPGHPGGRALRLARAEQRAEREGLRVEAVEEEESYESVYGEAPAEGYRYYCVAVYASDDSHDVLASLGFVDDDGSPSSRNYMRHVKANLLVEAFDVLDERREQAACIEATELAARATYAG